MKSKKIKSILLITAILFSFFTIIMPASAESASTTYYVDSETGNDNNSGTDENSAWKTLLKAHMQTLQPGDKLLFKRGCVWKGALYPTGSGVKGNPIIIDAYGEGSLPLIDGNGVYLRSGSTVDAAVYLKDQSYITIRNLEVTDKSEELADRQGIHIDGTTGSQTGITIENCVVHDISSDINNKLHTYSGGILVWARSWNQAYSDITIRNNEVYSVGCSGISVNARSDKGPAGGITVSGNYLHEIGGNGIVVMTATSPLIEHNTLNGAHLGSASVYCAGIWVFGCDNSLLQYNESYNNKYISDGQGFDADFQCHNTVFQYNYGHNNEGGFFLICCEPSTETTVNYNDGAVIRYNIAQNNSNSQFHLSSNITNTYIYNNTIYIDPSSNSDVVNTFSRDGISHADGIHFWNNIIYNLGSGGYYFGNSTNVEWDYNIFYGNHPGTEPNDAHKLTSDPLCIDAGDAGAGINSCDSYKLFKNSPAINSGKIIAGNGGSDYFGNIVSGSAAPNRGAYNGTGAEPFINPYKTSGGILTGINYESNSAEQFLQPFKNQTNIISALYDSDNNKVLTGKIGTGFKLNLKSDTFSLSYTLVLYGDINGDGGVDASDMLSLKKYMLKTNSLSGFYLTAADTDKSGTADAADLLKIKKVILRVSSISQF